MDPGGTGCGTAGRESSPWVECRGRGRRPKVAHGERNGYALLDGNRVDTVAVREEPRVDEAFEDAMHDRDDVGADGKKE